jgi:hypothetical protein
MYFECVLLVFEQIDRSLQLFQAVEIIWRVSEITASTTLSTMLDVAALAE